MKAQWRRFVCRCASVFQPAEQGPLICVAMVRNEMDILDCWIDHLLALFDRVIIYDHMSIDGTRERLHELASELPALDVRNFDEPGQAQSRLMTQTLREVSGQVKDGWMFFLDADEFVMIPGRDALRVKLERYRAATFLRLIWCNVMPVEPLDAPEAVLSGDTQVTGWDFGPIVVPKVAVNLRFADFVAEVRQGNHSVGTTERRPFRKVTVLKILHVPIRSRRQIQAKVTNGLVANALVDTKNEWVTHWKAFASSDAPEDPRRMVFNYGLQDPDKEKTTNDVPPAETISGTLSSFVPIGR